MQFPRMMQRTLARDLSGLKPFGESLTPQSNFTMADGADCPWDVASSTAAFGSILSFGQAMSGTRSGIAGSSASSGRTVNGGN